MSKITRLFGFVALLVILISSRACAFTYEQQSDSTTQTIINVPYYYVDNNISDVDFITDKGVHSNFTAQQYGPDYTNDNLTEVGVQSIFEDYVDSISDIDISPDIGSHSIFNNMKLKDSAFDILNETDNEYSIDLTGGYITSNTADLSISQGTISFWIKFDSTTLGRPVGQNTDLELRLNSNVIVLDWGGDNIMTSANTFTPNIWYFIAFTWDENADDLFFYVGTETSAPTQDVNSQDGNYYGTVSTITQATVRWGNGYGADQPVDGHMDDIRFYNTVKTLSEIAADYNQTLSGNESGLVNYYELNNEYRDSTGNDDATLFGSGAFNTDVPSWTANRFDLELEVQFNDVVDFLATEKLCIYMGNMDTEPLNVSYWNGSSWSLLDSDLTAFAWNNYTVALSGSTFSILFETASSEGDGNPDEYEVDAVLLQGNEQSYELDLEVQWTNVDYSEANEELCLYFSDDTSGSLDATGGYLIIGDGTADWGSSTGTISFWVKMDSTVQGRFWGQDGNMETRWSSNNLVLDWGGTASMISTTSFSADKWYFIAIVWDENINNLFLYIGDESNPPILDANSLSGTWFSTTPLPTENRFMNGLGGSEPVYGHGDDLRYWDIARSLAQLQSDYNKTLAGSETNLRSYFKLNNNFNDIGPDNNDASASGSYSFSADTVLSIPTTERIKVDVWTGSEWQNMFSNLTNGWNNATIASYLTSSTLTIRFKGDSETYDSTQDSWNIDTAVIHAWT